MIDIVTPDDADVNSTVYFGYGSNLWLEQMTQRCPTSDYKGVARLKDYRWHINERGYANVVQQESNTTEQAEVYGMVYTLESTDEKRLDRNEGVPWAYTKENLMVDFWEWKEESQNAGDKHKKWVDVKKQPTTKTEMLVYINRKQTTDGNPKEEYIHRMNEGIADAISVGVPEEYVKQWMRQFIPAQVSVSEAAKETAELQKQNFKEQR